MPRVLAPDQGWQAGQGRAALGYPRQARRGRRARREHRMTQPPSSPALHGVHHTARPTWKLRETLEFYRDVLGLRLVHAISARGWGPAEHPDFLHFFFDSGNGSTIAFFYYLGTEQPAHLVHH